MIRDSVIKKNAKDNVSIRLFIYLHNLYLYMNNYTTTKMNKLRDPPSWQVTKYLWVVDITLHLQKCFITFCTNKQELIIKNSPNHAEVLTDVRKW